MNWKLVIFFYYLFNLNLIRLCIKNLNNSDDENFKKNFTFFIVTTILLILDQSINKTISG